MARGGQKASAGRACEASHGYRRTARRCDLACAALLFGKFPIMVNDTTGVEIHPELCCAGDVFINPGVATYPQTDAPSVDVDRPWPRPWREPRVLTAMD